MQKHRTSGLPETWPNSAKSLRRVLTDCAQSGLLAKATDDWRAADLDRVLASWETSARDDQLPPLEAQGGGPWTAWVIMGGRGAGKTRTGSEWIKGVMTGAPDFTATPVKRVALIGETMAEVRDVMVEGVSGILAVHDRHNRPAWTPTRGRLQWSNGAVAQVYSAEDPESLRGPQFECAWLDEFAKWRYAEETFRHVAIRIASGRASTPGDYHDTASRPVTCPLAEGSTFGGIPRGNHRAMRKTWRRIFCKRLSRAIPARGSAVRNSMANSSTTIRIRSGRAVQSTLCVKTTRLPCSASLLQSTRLPRPRSAPMPAAL